jgi:hypothetical protein
MSKWTAIPSALYIGDNGHTLCGKHLGHSATATGRDISGQEVYRCTADDQVYSIEIYGMPLSCERCGHTPMEG